jgi:glucose/mannose transport system substrate-binding protein
MRNWARVVQVVSAVLVAGLALAPAAAQEVEVLHWWTSGGEAAALKVLKDDLQSRGVAWKDMPVAGGGGTQAMTVLRARVTAGNPPTAVQLIGFDITDWAELGVLADLNDIAREEDWETLIPPAVQRFSKHDGQWIAAPVNFHSTNWIFANKSVLDAAGVAIPTTWDELIAALGRVRASGKIALAHGGQAWQEATIFDSVVLATGGPEFYQRAFVELDPAALESDTMRRAFERMGELRQYVDPNFSGRDWNLATAMVVNGNAGFQIMGDWAKGEFLRAGQTPGREFECFRFPGTSGTVLYNSDQFAMFAVDAAKLPAQRELATLIMQPEFQSAFNVVKGSVPARTDVSPEPFDACGRQGIADVAAASAAGRLLGSMSQGYAAPAAVKNAIYDVVTAHFNGEYDAATAALELAVAVELAQ